MADAKPTNPKQMPASGAKSEKSEKPPKTEVEKRRDFGVRANKVIKTLGGQASKVERIMRGRGYAHSPAQRAALRDGVSKLYERTLSAIDGEGAKETPAVPIE